MNGYVKIHRQITEWGWYSNPATKDVFLHLLFTANFKESEYMGHKIMPGQTVIGLNALSEKLGLSVRNVRTALEHLEKTGEIDKQTTNKFTIITVVNWEKYQLECNEPTSKRQTTDKQPTNKRQHIKNDKNIYTDLFEKFWESYPKKQGKKYCEKLFSAIKPSDDLFDKMMSSLEKQKKSKQWQDKQYIPNPSTWLNQERWEDELEPLEPEREKYTL